MEDIWKGLVRTSVGGAVGGALFLVFTLTMAKEPPFFPPNPTPVSYILGAVAYTLLGALGTWS